MVDLFCQLIPKIVSFFMPNRLCLRRLFSVCLLACFTMGLSAQDGAPRTLKVEDYGKWENLGYSRGFSPSGEWFFYDIWRNNGKNELRFHNLVADTVKVLPQGQGAKFSADSRWLGYFITLSAAERKKSKKPLRNKFRLMDLNRGDSLTVEDVTDFSLSDDSQFLAMKHYPAKGKKSPMITYIYELLSDGLHTYGTPSQRNYYSTGVFTQEGYFVLRPDIVFDAADPGISSVHTMEAAVKKVVDMGIVDEKKVGLIGHFWGGYQAGYAVTQTDIFAASVAGAGLTNFTSMYGMIAWAFGGAPESAHFEVSQERMVVPPYEDVEGYIRNSSVFNVQNLNTPLLFEVGDNDKNVDWRQGIEYYNAARRAGKQFVLLVYANEGHGLRQDKNRSDYQMRILKWFGHYLKGEEAAEWINQGIRYEDQMKTLKNWKK